MNRIDADKRRVFEKAKELHPNRVITYSHLRIENELTNNASIYKFNVLKSNGVDIVTEVKLDKNDVFYMVTMGLFIYAQDNTAPGKAVLQTYPNQTHFTAAAGFVPTDLEIIYNAKMFVKIGATEWIQSLDTKQFRNAPQTQQSAATNYSQNDLDAGMIRVDPTFGLSGGDDTEIRLELPAQGSLEIAAVAANTQNQVVFFTRGYLVKNGVKDIAKTSQI